MRTDHELWAAVKQLHWFHNMELRPGVTTPGPADTGHLLGVFGLPEDLTGKTVLDIGCWDGFWSFECERRGAARVVASDVWESAGPAAFLLAREELGSKVIPLQCSVYDLASATDERFDLVLFLGVLYHLRHPLLALEAVAEMTRPGGQVIIDTVVSHPDYDQPVMAFYPGAELSDDPTNWWAPNPVAMEAMLEVTGFTAIERTVRDYYGNRSVWHAVKQSDEEVAGLAELDYRQRHKYQYPPYTQYPPYRGDS